MGVLGFADTNIESIMANDEQVSAEFDRRRQEIERVANAAVPAA